MAADCQVLLPTGDPCRVMAIGRCFACGNAFCSTHQARDVGGPRYIDWCTYCQQQKKVAETQAKELERQQEKEEEVRRRNRVAKMPLGDRAALVEYLRSGRTSGYIPTPTEWSDCNGVRLQPTWKELAEALEMTGGPDHEMVEVEGVLSWYGTYKTLWIYKWNLNEAVDPAYFGIKDLRPDIRASGLDKNSYYRSLTETGTLCTWKKQRKRLGDTFHRDLYTPVLNPLNPLEADLWVIVREIREKWVRRD